MRNGIVSNATGIGIDDPVLNRIVDKLEDCSKEHQYCVGCPVIKSCYATYDAYCIKSGTRTLQEKHYDKFENEFNSLRR